MKKIGLVLVAGGSGKRMNSSLPKQFIEINNKPILQYTIDLFLQWNKEIEIVLALPHSQIDYWKSISTKEDLSKYKICKGGKERFHSVKNALALFDDMDYIMVHDGVRPLVNEKTLDRCIQALGKHSSAIPVLQPSESIRIIKGESSETLNRDSIRLVQTPQCFNGQRLKESYEVEYDEQFTDDASVFSKAGHHIHLVEGNPENIKITRPMDLEVMKIYLSK